MREYTDKLTDWNKKSISDFVFYNCGIEQCKGGQFYGPKRRDYHFIHFVVKGEGTLEIKGNRYPVHENQLFIVPAEEVSTYQSSRENPWKYCWIGFLGIQSSQMLSSLMHCDPRRFVIDCMDAAFYERQIEIILGISGKQMSTHLRSNGIMYSLMGTLLEELGADDPEDLDMSIPYQAQQYMDQHYHNNLQIADVAAAIGVHANYLSNIFQEQYHKTPKQYLSGLRLKKARELLLYTEHPIYIVANSVGFTDQLAFSKFFRRMMGVSPSIYRMQRRHGNAKDSNFL